ncbi:MAG: DUF4301 family protein [Tannerellaceae bacterium]|jgi:hypothetical protein|nr:DUF4301 family protein [Tannerellaceae bacterium]
MWQTKDHETLAKRGITPEQAEEQLARFEKGFPFLNIVDTATIGRGVRLVPQDRVETYTQVWDNYLASGKKIVKFVPASGAASRMFKDLFAFLNEGIFTSAIQSFFAGIRNFAFYEALDAKCREHEGMGTENLMGSGRHKTVLSVLLGAKGLNYGQVPKGLLPFHCYADGQVRTALEEHLAEGIEYAQSGQGEINIHFTISAEHRTPFEQFVTKVLPIYEKRFSVRYRIIFSEQKLSTDTLAVDETNQPVRNADGSLLFRPGGHGALIENLNALDADIVFIKNIDNVVPDNNRHSTVIYKKTLAGVLISLQRRIFDYLRLIERGQYTREQIQEMIHFLHNELCTRNPNIKHLEDAELILYIRDKLNRPLRVCGMVRNTGEPGGGPFIAINPDGTWSPQILESSQIDTSNEVKRSLFELGTHFNPVDLVCALKNFEGKKFHLLDYIDPDTGFISIKSKDGHTLKALELPGLWNGAMSDWNTAFVEVPIDTFNPVKTVNDLLRPEHQSAV